MGSGQVPRAMSEAAPAVWVLDADGSVATQERLGDARVVADQLGARVGVVAVGGPAHPVETLVAHGADLVVHAVAAASGPATAVLATLEALGPFRPRLVLAGGDAHGREWAARLAVRAGWLLVSPALVARVRGAGLEVVAIGSEDRRSRRVRVPAGTPAVVTLRPGVGEARPAVPGRPGEVRRVVVAPRPEPVSRARHLPADPEAVDIRFAPRLIAGGRGLARPEGFELLRRFARRIGAGVAASRMAVDLGWIERERQVGQTGKTVAPELYLACGISGASHHLAGMAGARHVVAINTDPEAPIFQAAHLGLVADLYDVLRAAEAELDR